MPRPGMGTLDWSSTPPYVRLTIGGRRKAFRLATSDPDEAQRRREVLARIARRLADAGKDAHAEALCQQAAAANDRTLSAIIEIVDGLVEGREHAVGEPMRARTSAVAVTFKDVGKMWTSGDLAKRFRRRIKDIDHTENIARFERYVYPFVYEGKSIAATPIGAFTTDHGDAILAQPEIPDGSVRHVAQLVSRVCKLAAYPLKAIARSPLPAGWLPPRNGAKEKSYLFPTEEADFQRNTKVPLVRRLLVGVCAREGLRKENAVTLEWPDLVLDQGDDAMVVLDMTKNGRGGSWVLDPGTAEALRRWRKLCTSERYVFPTSALPRHRRTVTDRPLYVDHLAGELRDGLQDAGVKRAKLFERSNHRMRLRAHDLRATFVTLALADGKTEDWVVTRTGHGSSQMIALYRRQAKTAAELKLGWLRPLHEVVPELAGLRGK
jgi:integrase